METSLLLLGGFEFVDTTTMWSLIDLDFMSVRRKVDGHRHETRCILVWILLPASALCHARLAHNKANVLPDPVGLSSRQCWPRCNPRITWTTTTTQSDHHEWMIFQMTHTRYPISPSLIRPAGPSSNWWLRINVIEKRPCAVSFVIIPDAKYTRLQADYE